ncbi:hypothetical protein SAMN04488498_11473 [Mesorhizobium albiziae]|uniref:Uncharacterized protein n=1 Tax=Neomesorhizobium albiziae TaxID=335020 RepID=A0A1I4CTE4_9HYPH|nr:hypothetical protein [Mesorhizobium albiziae]GLS30998.1 hypothetical protein GCM10007937_27070 [Mesorhizobium albiziae]SFK84053.1 hypothetical protein SAMN04488498_11473 [Mesorhizobium albiziae]
MNAPFRPVSLPQTLHGISHETRTQWFEQRIRILRWHPDFPVAAHDHARGMVKLFEGRFVVNRAMANAARQTICMAILSLHFGKREPNPCVTTPAAGAMTTALSSIQSLTTAMGVCSKNTTAATVLLLERIGLVKRVENQEDRRALHIVPTELLIEGARDIVRVSLTSADTLFPLRNYSALIDDRDFLESLFAASLHSLLNRSSLISSISSSHLFAASDGGAILLFKLMSMDGASADERVVEFPFDEIGPLFGVSRTHIRRLMKKAEAEGLVRLLQDGGRQVQILPQLQDVFESIVAMNVARAQFDMHLANGDYDLLPFDY